ncbi:MAG: heparinase II/III domain-containing protein [Candidatus Zipacnadales bacterium]
MSTSLSHARETAVYVIVFFPSEASLLVFTEVQQPDEGNLLYPRYPGSEASSMRNGFALMFVMPTVLLTAAHSGCQQMSPHPRLLVNAQTLPRLRAKAADETTNAFGFDTKSAWAVLKSRADTFVAAAPYHYSVNIPLPDNKFAGIWEYTLSDAMPPRHDDTPAYPPWTAMFQEREDSITSRLIHLSFAYLITQEKAYAEVAKTIALHLSHWDQWTDPSYSAGRLKACLDTGHCTYAVSMCYDWCFDYLSEMERTQIRQAICTKGIEACLAGVEAYPPDTNGFAVITSGATLGAIAVLPEEPRASEWLATCLEKIRTSLDRGGKDGGAFEGPMYGTYLLDSFAKVFDALEAANIEHNLFEHPYLGTMTRYCLSQMAPDTKEMPCFGDGSPTRGYPQLMSILAHRGDTDAAWYIQQIGAIRADNIYDFIRLDTSRLQPRQPEWNPSQVLVDIGHASLRTGYDPKAPSLFFKSGPYTNNIGHNHFDHNAFVISYGGEWIVPDRGYHVRYDPAQRKFTLGSMGHNTVVLDVDEAYLARTEVPDEGHDQVKRTGGQIIEHFAGEGFDFVTGAAAEAYNTPEHIVLDRFDRTILYVKPYFFVVYDRLVSPQPHAFNFLLHGDGSSVIAPLEENFTITRMRAELIGRIASSTPSTRHIEAYPGAEQLGRYVRVETAPTTKTEFVAFLYPRPNTNPLFIRNGNFEAGMAGWRPRANEDLPNHRIVTERPAEGAHCAQIENSGYYYSDYFVLPEGKEVTARVQVRTTELPADKGATMTLYFWRDGKAFASQRVGPFAHSNWQEHAVTAVVPKGTQQVCLALEFFAPGTGWFDDVRIEATVEEMPATLTPRLDRFDTEGLDVTLADERYLICIGDAGVQREVTGMQSDGELAVVALRGGEPVRAFVKKGTFVSFMGRDLLRLGQPGTAEVIVSEGIVHAQVTYDVTPHALRPQQTSLQVGWPAESATLNGRPANIEQVQAGSRLVIKP